MFKICFTIFKLDDVKVIDVDVSRRWQTYGDSNRLGIKEERNIGQFYRDGRFAQINKLQ